MLKKLFFCLWILAYFDYKQHLIAKCALTVPPPACASAACRRQGVGQQRAIAAFFGACGKLFTLGAEQLLAHMHTCSRKGRHVCAKLCVRTSSRWNFISRNFNSAICASFSICCALSQLECPPFSYGLHMVHLCAAAVAYATLLAWLNEALVGVAKKKTAHSRYETCWRSVSKYKTNLSQVEVLPPSMIGWNVWMNDRSVHSST